MILPTRFLSWIERHNQSKAAACLDGCGKQLFGYSENKTIKIRLIVIDQSNAVVVVSKVSTKPRLTCEKYSADEQMTMFPLTLTSEL